MKYLYFLKKHFLNYLFKYNLYKDTAKIVCIDLVYLHLNNTFISPLNIITKNIDDTNTKDPSNANFCIYIYMDRKHCTKNKNMICLKKK